MLVFFVALFSKGRDKEVDFCSSTTHTRACARALSPFLIESLVAFGFFIFHIFLLFLKLTGGFV